MDFAFQELLRPGALGRFRLKVAGRVLAPAVWVLGRFRAGAGRIVRQSRPSDIRGMVQKGGLYFPYAAANLPVLDIKPHAMLKRIGHNGVAQYSTGSVCLRVLLYFFNESRIARTVCFTRRS